MGKGFRKLIHGISTAGGGISSLIIVFMVLGTMADVTMRYFFNMPIAGVIEHCSILLPVLVFLGLAVTQKVGGHIGVTLFLKRFSPGRRAIQEIINLFVCLIFVGAMGVETWKGALYSYSIKEYRWGVVGQDISIWWAKFAMSIGFWLLFLQYTADIAKKISELRSGQYSKELPSVESQKGIL